MPIDLLKLPTPCRSGQLCQLCRDTLNPAAESFRRTQQPKFPQMYGPGFVCNFGLPWDHKGPSPWAGEFAAYVRAQMQDAAADQLVESSTFGPGDVVKLALARMGYQPHPACGCEEFRLQMNAWGWRGCMRRRREIIDWFASKARERNIQVTSDSIWSLVRGGMKDLLARRRERNPLSFPFILPRSLPETLPHMLCALAWTIAIGALVSCAKYGSSMETRL